MEKSESISIYSLRKRDLNFISGIRNYVERIAPDCVENGLDCKRFLLNAALLSMYNSAICISIFIAGNKICVGLEKLLY